MPYRHAITLLEHVWRWLVVMYEPAIAYGLALGAAATAAGAGSDGHSLADVRPMEAFGFIMGWVIDFGARGRVYGALPPAKRKSRWREMKERTLWSAIGLGAGAVLAFFVNESLEVAAPPFAHAAAPLVNMVAVGVIALPLIDASRGIARMAAGQTTQEAMAGLVVGWLFRRAGQTPPAPPPPSPGQGGQGDAS